MSTYLKEFATQQEYEAYINGSPLTPCVSLIDENDSVKYKQKPDYSKQYLTFTALEDGTFKLSGNTVNYSLDGGETWTSLASNTNTPTIHTGEKIMWKAELTETTGAGIGRFSSTGQYDVEGNVMSLKYGDNFIDKEELPQNNRAFGGLFGGSSGLTSAENLVLPATTLATECYYYMFNNCTSLITAPELYATTLAKNCYQNMFQGCTSLTTAPELPATTLTSSCYREMFKGCSSLNYIKMLATNTTASQCLNAWVSGVAATGTFVKAASANLPTGKNGIPENWTVQNA